MLRNCTWFLVMADNFSKTAIITVEIVIKNMLRNGWIYIFSSNSTVFPLICMSNTCQIIWVSVARGSGCPCCTFQSTFLAVIIMSNVNTKTFIELIQILCQYLCGIWNIREMQHTLSEVWFFFFTNIIRLRRGTESRSYLFMECKPPCFCRHQKMETKKMLQQIEGKY